MDSTPVKSDAFSPPVSKFEDSPVFNYINELSPIKPLCSPVSGQAFHFLSFASPKTSIVSPVVNCLQESKITSDLPCLSQPESSDGRNKSDRCQVILGSIQPLESHSEKSECLKSSIVETASAAKERPESAPGLGQCMKNDRGLQPVETNAKKAKCYESRAKTTSVVPNVSKKSALKLPCCMANNYSGPDARSYSAMKHCFASKTEELDTKSILFHEDFSTIEKGSFNNEMASHGHHQGQIKGVVRENEWEKLLCEASDQLPCNSPFKERHIQELDSMQIDPGTLSFMDNIWQLSQENANETQKTESLVCPSDEQDLEMPLACTEGTRKANEAHQVSTCTQFADKAAPRSSAEVDNKPQMIWRHCLVSEMSGSHYRKLMSKNSTVSERSAHSAATRVASSVHGKPEIRNFSSVLPGIGLHLNALATSGRDKKLVLKQGLNSKRKLISLPSANMPSPHSMSSDGGTESTPMDLNPSADSETRTEQVNLVNDVSHSLEFEGGEGLKHSSTKRKRSKAENSGDGESCKLCNCKRSKCLKLYCECFAAGLYCVEPCSCQGCFNKPAYEEIVLETRRLIEARNPLAFAPKVIKVPDIPEFGDELSTTPASARHKQGCNCKKSNCLKKYCECFQGGVGCSFSCRCEGCKNSFGCKYGMEDTVYEETASDNNDLDGSLPDTVDMEHQDPHVMPATGISSKPFSSMSFASPSLVTGSLLQQCTSHRPKKPSSLASHSGVESQTQNKIIEENEALNTSKDDSNSLTTKTGIKARSPNSKRVSPPRVGTARSPVRKFCRKLILRSIPSLPPLPHKIDDDGTSLGNPT